MVSLAAKNSNFKLGEKNNEVLSENSLLVNIPGEQNDVDSMMIELENMGK